MKLRKFFKKFVIPRTLNKEKKSQFMEDLSNIEIPKDERKLRLIKADSDEIFSLDRKEMNRNQVSFDDFSKSSKKNRSLSLIPNRKSKKIRKMFKRIKKSNKSRHLRKGRSLATETTEAKPAEKKALLIYDQELYHFYNEIFIPPPQLKEPHIFKMASKRINVDKLHKTFAINDGIDP